MSNRTTCVLSGDLLSPDDVEAGVVVCTRVRLLVDVVGLLAQEAQLEPRSDQPGCGMYADVRRQLAARGELLTGSVLQRFARATGRLNAAVAMHAHAARPGANID